MIKGIIRSVWGAIFDHSRAHGHAAHDHVKPEFEVEFEKQMAERRRADIQRRIRAIELMYDSQSRAAEQDR